MRLVVGLGNPGPDYEGTRHNIGFLVVDRLARQYRIALKHRGFLAHWGRGKAGGTEVVLAKPQTFMNRSDLAVCSLLKELRLGPTGLVVVHDDLDLEPGRLRIRPYGGSGGHRGVLSLIEGLGTDEFVRVRVGIGRPPPGIDPIDYVLAGYADSEAEQVAAAIQHAAAAIVAVIEEGAEAAMNRYN
ncbi:MAG TPA: aminoacyl-tRNA hydrolase [Clostridiales bacterium UBA8153]|nr:aminoacyl-tRNA hydrolase [Clostridiales bacterium UBA8153]